MNDVMPADGAAPRLPSLFRNRDFMLLWSGQTVSALGSQMSAFALPLLILALTKSPTQAGIAGFFATVPYVIFSLPAGALIDRWDRKKVMIRCDVGRAIALGSIPVAAALGHLTVVQLYIAATIEGTLFVFFNIAEVACLPRVVPKEQLPLATSRNEAAGTTSFLVAPTISGILFQTIGRTVPWLVDSISYVISVISLTLIRAEFQEERTAVSRRLHVEIVEGLRWLWRQPLIRYMAFCTGMLNFTGNASILIWIVLAKHLHASAAFIGVMFSVASVGGVVGALVAPWFHKRYGFGQVIVTTVWIQALLYPLFAVAPNPIVLGIIGGLGFFTSPIYNIVQFSYRLSIIPDELQGRVNSVFRLVAFGFNPLGFALSGLLLDRIGITPTIMVFSAVVLALAILTNVYPQVRRARPIAPAAAA